MVKQIFVFSEQLDEGEIWKDGSDEVINKYDERKRINISLLELPTSRHHQNQSSYVGE